MTPDFSLRPILEAHPNGVSINELMVKTRLSHRQIKTALDKLPVLFDGEYYHLYNSPEQKAILQARIAQNRLAKARTAQQIATEAAQEPPKETVQAPKEAKKPTKRHPPFTPNPIMGYQVQQGKAKIFLDRTASSKTLTLSLDDLKELVMAVEKVGRL